ncbi:membrane protein implicated in regulation of membrane protease activity [Mobilisporobacter senegalensis]|uniref:Membrane protein implicated in regulation of membrane protease activity n=1 Tax=Mobilisporobacter senegalensis TaxID=1329262 RepID=A0A3N1XPH2_9FIRM|nr:NfeD family protein [Mobilisporobacter senegalensis]ROR28584.1 membrane protein implicated in regulation of membrane protease activity [Mobilisporobacter senegalensis]
MEAVYWLILLAILIVIEIATLGLTTIWFAGGALVAFVAAMLGGNDFIQIVLFFVVSFALLYFTRPIAVKYLNANRTKTNYEELIGKEAKVITKIDNFNQSGSVMVNGLEWTARTKEDGKIILPDTKVTIVKVSGVKLIVTDNKEDL